MSVGDTGAVSLPLTFTTTDWNTTQTVTVSGVADADAVDESVTVTATASSVGDADYDGPTATVTVTVTDTDTAGVVVDPATLTVSEDGSGSFTVRLATQPTADVSVTVSSGDTGAVSVDTLPLTFTTTDWNTTQTVTVTGVADADAVDESVTVTATAASVGDADYDGPTATVTVTVTDTDTAGVVVDPATLTVSEDGSGSFTVKLATRPSADVSVTVSSGDTGAVSVDTLPLTFTTTDWNTTQTVTVTGVADADAVDESVTVTATAASTGDADYDGPTATVTVTVTDTDTAGVVVDPTTLMISEDGSGSFTVKLATQPTADVSVTVSSGDTGAVSVDTLPLTFTTTDWNTTQTVTVSGVADADAVDESVTVTATAASVGDADYDGPTATVTVTVTDTDTAGVVVDPATLTVSEDGSGSFTVKLATRPSADVSVTVSSGDTGAVSVDTLPLTFTTTDWNTTQTVTVSGVADADGADETVTVTATASSTGDADYDGPTAEVTVTVVDSDCSAGASTLCSVAVGGSVLGGIETAGDVDWFSVELVGLTVGNTYLFEVAGDGGSGELADPVVRLFDADGGALVPDVVDSDADGDGTAGVAFTPAADGSYFVAVSEDGDDATGTYTVAVSEVFNGIEQISVGPSHVCAVLVDASVSCWGGSSAGEGSPPGGVRFVQVAASLSHSCGLAGEGSITCWGDDSDGRATPPAGTDFVAVVGGQEHSCGLRSSGAAVCWGNNTKGQRDVPSGVVFSSLAAGWGTTCGVQADHAAVCWGADNFGQASPPSGVSFSVVSVGGSHGCGIKTDQSVVCWGDERGGKTAPPSGSFSAIAASEDSSCGLTSGGTIQCWGRNEHNVLRAPLGQFVSVAGSAGASAVCARTSAGTAACWGSGAAGTVPAGLAAVVSFGADPNTPPFFFSATLGSVEVAEGAPLSTSVAVVEDDPSDDVESVVVVSSAASEDHDLFEVYQDAFNNHRLRFTGGFVADFEDPQDSDTGNDYVVVLRATSGTGARAMSTDVTVTVTVTNVECAGDDTTTCELAVGATDKEGIETAGDTDWFDVDLTADTAYRINVAGGSGAGELADPVVRLFDENGDALVPDVVDSDADDDGTASVTFTPGTDATFYVEASEDGDDATGSYTVLVTELVDLAVVVVPESLSVTEGSAATYGVTLGALPTTDVEVRITRTGRGVSVSPWRLMFTPSDYDTAQIVTVTGNDDSDAEDHTVTLSHRAIGGEFEGASADVTVTVTDDDTALVTLDTATTDLGLAVGEGDSISYTMVLDTRPSADVTVTVTPGSSKVVVFPSTLRFTDYDWHVPQTVTVTAVVDDDATDETTTLAHSAAGGGYDAVTIDPVTVSVTDDDTAAVTVLPTSLTIEEGSSAGYVVVLDSEPSATVTVTVSVSGSNEVSVSPTPLTFTASNWSAAQTVTVSAATDADTIGDTATISHTIAGGDYATVSVPDVSVSVTDGATLGVTVSPASLTVPEDDKGDYTVVLDAAPTGDVTVTLSVSGSDEVTVAPSELTFTTADWQIEQMVEVTASADTDVLDEAAAITHTLSGGGYGSVAAPTVLVAVTDRRELPTLESVQAGDEGFLATWSPAAAHAGGTITKYQIRYRVLNGSTWTKVDVGTGTSFQVTGMTGQNNANHEVAVRVFIDGNAVNPWSETMQVRIGEPSGPTKLTVEGSDTLLHIFWEPPANHESLTANGKRIRYFVRVLASGYPNNVGGWYTWDTHLARPFTSQGELVENGTQYTVDVQTQLYAANSDTALVDGGSASATGTPADIDVPEGDFRHAVLRDTIEHIVATQEATQGADLAGWLRLAWDWVSTQSARAEEFSNPDWRNFNTNVQDAPEFFGATVSYCADTETLVGSETLRECYSTSIAIDLAHLCGDSIGASQYYACMDTATAIDLDPEALAANVGLIDTVIHELMHVYTATIREMTVNVGASALPVGVANLHSLANNRSAWTLSEDLCPNELLAIAASMILLGEVSSAYAPLCLGYTGIAPLTCDEALAAERCDVLRDMVKGNVAQWYTDRYEGDAEQVWADVIELTTFDGVRDVAVGVISKLGLVWGLAEEFGGYCSPLAANNAMFDADTTIFNPWVEGGCEPDAPPSVTVTRGSVANTFEVSWTAPDSEGGADLLAYELEWKRGSQPYSSTRRTLVADNVLSATIDVGAGTADTYFRVLAVNEIGESTGGEVTCTNSGGTWTCTFEAPAERGTRGAGETQRWPVSKDLPKQIVIQTDRRRNPPRRAPSHPPPIL